MNNQKDIYTIIDNDAKKISKCKSLRKLVIVNQPGISHIDVSELNNVLNLEISDNQNLKEITGLKQLEKIQIFNCYGNNILGQIDGLDTFIVKSKKLQKLYLDVQQFPNAIGYNYVSGKYNTSVLKKIDKIKETCWKELVFNNSSIQINTKQMLQMHNKAYKIVEKNIPQSSDRTNTILGIENYIAKNIKYDNKDTMYSKYEASGTYNALKLNKCIDNGYTNGMRYLLKLKGINSHNITCLNTQTR